MGEGPYIPESNGPLHVGPSKRPIVEPLISCGLVLQNPTMLYQKCSQNSVLS